jgi:hypothetical protein
LNSNKVGQPVEAAAAAAAVAAIVAINGFLLCALHFFCRWRCCVVVLSSVDLCANKLDFKLDFFFFVVVVVNLSKRDLMGAGRKREGLL